METAEKAHETEGEMDAQFVVLAEDEDGFALAQAHGLGRQGDSDSSCPR